MISSPKIDNFNGYNFGSNVQLTDVDKNKILSGIKSPNRDKKIGLEGRAGVRKINLDRGPIVIKEYRRGGLLGRLLGNVHFKFGPGRAETEYEFLTIASSHGIHVPTPIAFVESTGFLYEAWLAMEEIPEAVSLSECSRKNSDLCDPIIDSAATQIIKLIQSRIFHLDLHPGNVIKDRDGKVYLIDFDKAKTYRGSLKELRDLYLCRWRRAVIKHNLPSVLAERMSLALRRVDVWDTK